MKTYEIRLNGKSTGWFGNHKDCVEVLKHLERKASNLQYVIYENTGLDVDSQDYLHNVNAVHIGFTHQNRKTRTSRSGTYKNASLKTPAPNNTGKTVFGYDGFVDVWAVKEIKGE